MIYTTNYCRHQHRHLHHNHHKHHYLFTFGSLTSPWDCLALNQNRIEAITARYVVKYPIQKALRSDYHLIDIPRPIYKEPLSCYSLLLLLLGNNWQNILMCLQLNIWLKSRLKGLLVIWFYCSRFFMPIPMQLFVYYCFLTSLTTYFQRAQWCRCARVPKWFHNIARQGGHCSWRKHVERCWSTCNGYFAEALVDHRLIS